MISSSISVVLPNPEPESDLLRKSLVTNWKATRRDWLNDSWNGCFRFSPHRACPSERQGWRSRLHHH